MSSRLTLILLLAVCIVAPSHLSAQTDNELATKITESGYPREMPAGPPESSLSEWAHAGRVRFINWDGGPLETCKAFLSGWPNFNPPNPDYVNVQTNWLDLSTIRFLRDAHVNTIFATFGIGYSIETETRQRDLLRAYTEECHRQGIHVIAYQTLTNVFEDLLERVPESRDWLARGEDGKTIAYGAADYSKMGRTTRFLADPTHPGWRNYLKRMMDLAIESGMDGVFYDNCLVSRDKLIDAFQMLVPYALSKKKQFVLMANFHDRDYVLHRLLNAMIGEDGGEAGVFYEKNVEQAVGYLMQHSSNRWLGQRGIMLRVEGGYLVNNVGRFRVFENLSEGWKPYMADNANREVGTRETHLMAPERFQLNMAEAMMFNVANTAAVEGRLAYGLWYGEADVLRLWKAIGQYNQFFAEHEEYYPGTRSVASLALVLDNSSKGIPLFNAIAGRGVMFNVFYESELTPEKLKPYAAVALLDARMVRDSAVSALKEYTESGGRVFLAGRSATQNETGAARKRPAWFGQKVGKGECIYWETVPPVDEVVAALRAADRPALVEVEAPPYVLYNVKEQADTGRLMIHLTNYLLRPVDKVIVKVRGKHEKVALFTPDAPDAKARVTGATEEATEIEVPWVKIYALLVIEGKR